MTEPALTLKQPWSSLVIHGQKDVENRSWPVPSTLPQWMLCETCGARDRNPWRPSWSGHVPVGADHGWRRADGPCPFRLWIHAGRSIDYPALCQDEGVRSGLQALGYGSPADFERRGIPLLGVLLGHVTVTGCHNADGCWHQAEGPSPICDPHCPCMNGGDGTCSRWAQPDCWHWELADPVALPGPIPVRGRQKLWRLPDEIHAQALTQLEVSA